MQHILRNKEKYRVQIIYTRIDRDASNRPSFKNFYFNTGDSLYYYPASTVKLPLAAFLSKNLTGCRRREWINSRPCNSTAVIPGKKPLYKDSTSETGFPSIAQFIRKAFLISDNDAYNRMYEFVGQQEINRSLHAQGLYRYADRPAVHALDEDENRHTNQIRFLDKNGKISLISRRPTTRTHFNFSSPAILGKAYLDAEGQSDQ